MMSKYFLLVITLTLLVGVASGSIVSLNETHGESWIKWVWSLDGTDFGQERVISLSLDGVVEAIYNLNSTTPALVPTYRYVTGLNGDEQHIFKVTISDVSTDPPTTLSTESSIVTTSQPAVYYYLVLALAFFLFIVSLFMAASRLLWIGIFMDVVSVILCAYLAVTTMSFNPALSTISILLGIMPISPILYALYKLYENSQNWRE